MGIKNVQGNNKDLSKPLTADAIHRFERFLENHGLERKDPVEINPGKPQRAYTVINNKRALSGYYAFYDNYGTPVGFASDYRTGQTHNFKMSGVKAGKIDTEALARFKEEARLDQEQKWLKVSEKAKMIWDVALPCDSHPYLLSKGVASHSLREHKGKLIIPIMDETGKLWSLQMIDTNGGKRFLSGGKTGGCFFIVGTKHLKEATKVGIGEGYATCMTIYEQKQIPMIVCFNAGNMLSVSKKLSEALPNKEFIIYADNDENDVGKDKAIAAAQITNAEVVMPEEEGMDFNDQVAISGELIEKRVEVPELVEFEKTSNGRIMATTDNYEALMKGHGIECYYDVIKKRIDIEIPNFKPISDLKDEALLVEVENLCIKNFVPHQRVRDAMKIIAKEVNPVAAWIDSNPWDGVSRIDDFCNTVKSKDITLKNMLMKKWLLSCVAAAFEEGGVALEGLLVFQGSQGLGKTLWFKRLADFNKGWLCEGATLDPKDKDSVKKAVSHWIVELGELESTFKKADINQLKAFITSRSDEMRLPYDRSFTNYQRRTAFFASVNEPEFLMDGSGNRRFWCIKVTDIDPHHGIDMQQMWAEVKATLYQPGVKNWYLTTEEREMLQESNEGFRTQGAVEDLLLQHVDFDALDTEKIAWQLTALLRALGIRNPRNIDFKDASRVLTDHGIEPRKTNGKKVYDVSLVDLPEDKSMWEESPF
jgi:putative DNA primase/helicase